MNALGFRVFGRIATWLGVLMFAICMSIAAVTNAGDRGTIKIAENDWTGQWIDINVVKIILERELNYDVELIFADYGGQWEAIANGDLDLTMEIWPDWSLEQHQEYIVDKKSIEVIGPLGVTAETGWFVPTYVIKGDAERGIEPMAPNLKSWKQLNDYVDLFKRPESGDKGLCIDGVAAWETNNEDRIANLGLNYMNVYSGTEGAMWAEILGAYERGDPIFACDMWSPHWVYAKYDFTEIELPPYTDECNTTTHACDWKTQILYNIARVGFKDEFPDAYQLIENMRLTNADQESMMFLIDSEGLSVEESVAQWIDNNKDTWQTWLP